MDTINFYSTKDAFGCFSNFSAHRVDLDGDVWPTSEHYFQAQKFEDADYRERIRTTPSPMVAARMGRSRKVKLRDDWDRVKDSIMRKVVLAKFTQHEELAEILLSTDDARLVEHTTNDSYWADGGDGSGKNMLGQILMSVRDEIRRERLESGRAGASSG